MLTIPATADREMELLSLLSCEPAPLNLLAADLNLKPREVVVLAHKLQERGYAVILMRSGGGNNLVTALSLARRGADEAKRDAGFYVDETST